MDKNEVAVIVPIYKETLLRNEKISLIQCHKVLSNYPIIAVKPKSLIVNLSKDIPPFADTISFDNSFFAGISGYNKLMLSADFYHCFLKYKFILIYQLDAFVFKDDLKDWCKTGYDYAGAPWLRPKPYPDVFKALKSFIQYFVHRRFNIKKDGLPTFKQFENNVGNGGFSLRKVKTFYDLSIRFENLINLYLSRNEHQFNEDVFWSIELNRKKKLVKKPDYIRATSFAFDASPERAYVLNKQKLPFGCHGWHLNIDFWKPFFKEIGYDI